MQLAFFQPEGKEHRKSQSFILDPNGNDLTLLFQGFYISTLQRVCSKSVGQSVTIFLKCTIFLPINQQHYRGFLPLEQQIMHDNLKPVLANWLLECPSEEMVFV